MKNRHSRLRLLALWIGIGCVASQGLAQSTSLLRGTLTDPQGAAIADAKITITNAETGLTRNAVTGENGEYQPSALVSQSSRGPVSSYS
jgi:hypothetical protein